MRTKNLTSIENEINETKTKLVKLEKRHDNLENHLEELYEQRRSMQEKNLFEKFLSSGKSWNDVIKFLTPQ